MRVKRSHLGLTPAEINAAVQAAASGSGSTGTTSSTSTTGTTAAASITAAVTRAGGGTSVTPEQAATRLRSAGVVGATITAVLGAAQGAATAAGGSAGQWIAFVLGGPAPAAGTTIAPGDLNTLKDWVVNIVNTVGPLVASLRTDSNPDVSTAAKFFVGENGTSGYLYTMKTAILNAWTAAQTPAAAPLDPEPVYDPGTGSGGGGVTTQTSEATYLLPIGAIALAAILFFLKR